MVLLPLDNIMSYPGIKLNGNATNEYVPNKFDRIKVSPGQILQIIKQIDTDEKKTEKESLFNLCITILFL